MAFEITQDRERGIIQVRYFGRVTIAQRVEAMEKTLIILGETDLRRIVIDFDAARAGSEAFQNTNAFATMLATNALLRQCRIAFVGSASNRFNTALEMLADGRGYAFRRFFERAPAIDWLLS